MTERTIQQIIKGMPSSDGDGVKLTRSLGQTPTARLDPFLMLDEFKSDDSADYIGGFPPHPHRGFETVTYMLAGAMRHEDSLGNTGYLRAGDVQWMTAARGIIHSEMPEQKDGLMHGFQLWINLPAEDKMKQPRYQDIASNKIAEIHEEGVDIRVIVGEVSRHGEVATGPVSAIATEPRYLDVQLQPGVRFEQSTPADHNALIYVFDGALEANGDDGFARLEAGRAGVLSDGDQVVVTAGEAGARFLLLSARPIGEPIAQYGPFVMNTREEIEQAIRDYQNGEFSAQPAMQ